MAKRQFLRVGFLLIILLSTISFTVLAERQSASLPYSGDEPGAPAAVALVSDEPPKWSETLYYNIAGVTFRARSSGTTWESSGNCLYVPSGGEFLNSALVLPNGSVLEQLFLDYYNTSDTHADLYLTRYDGRGNQTDLLAINTSQTGGYVSEESGYLGLELDNDAYSYVINFRPNINTDEMRLCGIRIEYKTP